LAKGACLGARKVLIQGEKYRNLTPFFMYSQKLSWDFEQQALNFQKWLVKVGTLNAAH